MRATAATHDLSVRAIAGTYSVLLGMNSAPAAIKGLLGFAIRRTDHTENEDYYLRGLLTFPETAHGLAASPLITHPVNDAPVQDFKWGDYTAKPDHSYTYTIYPVYGTPKALRQGDPVAVSIDTESVQGQEHGIFFNRGAVTSQAFERKFGQVTKADLENPKSTAGQAALAWLSRGLEEAILAFIARAKGKGWGLHGSLYEFTHMPILNALAAARARGVDLQLVIDDMGAAKENAPCIKQAKLQSVVTNRKAPGISISHNKFLVLLQNGKPVSVWSGSTNITLGGIYGQSNVGHSIENPALAAQYLSYWNQIHGNPPRKTFAPWNDTNDPLSNAQADAPGTQVVFSPRSNLDALNYYAQLMDQATGAVFLTAAFGLSNQFTQVLTRAKPYLRYILMDSSGQASNRKNTKAVLSKSFDRVAIGDFIHPGALADWYAEHSSAINDHVKYIHTKYMLINPLSDSPTVLSGSANFSEASTTKNDENMLIIRGSTRVADIYLTEFMRLFTQYYFRDRLDAAENASDGTTQTVGKNQKPKPTAPPVPRSLYLAPDDSWTARYYKPGTVSYKERMLYSGALPGH